jgi:hypothetical protein
MNTDLVCIVCFGTDDRELARFTTLRLNPKINRELGKTMVESVIHYWANGSQSTYVFKNTYLVEWLRRHANRIYRHRLPSTQNRKSKWVSKKAIKGPILAFAILGTGTAWAGSFRVLTASRDITVQAESSAEARRIVMDTFPNAVVTGVQRQR